MLETSELLWPRRKFSVKGKHMRTGHFQLESRWHSKSWLESQVFGDQNEFPFRGRAEAVFRLPRQPVKLFPTLPRNALLKEGSSSEPSFPHLPTHCVNRAVRAGATTWWEISVPGRWKSVLAMQIGKLALVVRWKRRNGMPAALDMSACWEGPALGASSREAKDDPLYYSLAAGYTVGRRGWRIFSAL